MSKSNSKSNKKKSSTKTANAKVNPEQSNELPVEGEVEEEFTAGEKLLLASKPYWPHILLGVLCLILGSVLWSSWSTMSKESASVPWQDLNNAVTQAGLTNDVSSLKEMASAHEGSAAGNWALLMAADDEINRGLRMLPSDRKGGFKLIETGIDSVKRVVDAPASSKTPMVQRRSTFLLAQANEAVGKFDVAKENYQYLVDNAGDSPFAAPSERGVARCSSEDLAMVYDNFLNFEEAAEVAPGPLVPDAPKLNVDEFKLPEGEPDTFDAGGGDFSAGTSDGPAAEAEKEEAVTEPMETPAAAETAETPAEAAVEAPAEPATETPVADPEPIPETPAVEPSTPEVQTEEPVTPEVPATEPAVPEVSAEVTPTTPEIPSEIVPTDVVPETPAVEVPAVEVPAVEVPAVEVPAVEVPAVEVPAVPAAE